MVGDTGFGRNRTTTSGSTSIRQGAARVPFDGRFADKPIQFGLSAVLSLRRLQPVRTIRHLVAAAPLSGPWTANAPVAVELFSIVSSLPLLTLRIFAVPSPWSRTVHRWSAVPLSDH